jgi:hypothetical protein
MDLSLFHFYGQTSDFVTGLMFIVSRNKSTLSVEKVSAIINPFSPSGYFT